MASVPLVPLEKRDVPPAIPAIVPNLTSPASRVASLKSVMSAAVGGALSPATQVLPEEDPPEPVVLPVPVVPAAPVVLPVPVTLPVPVVPARPVVLPVPVALPEPV